MGKLYAVEVQVKDLQAPERLQLRQALARPVTSCTSGCRRSDCG